jgi:hypothetical protein
MKTTVLIVVALMLVTFTAVQASAFTYDYHTYVLGYGDVSNGYTNTESNTYDKLSTSSNTPWGSQDHVVIKRTDTQTFQPNYPNFNINNDGFHMIGYDNYWQNNNNNVITVRAYDPYQDPRTIFPTNWRYKTTYYAPDYPSQNDYGHDYYYQPTYDWHQQVYNWAY